MPPPPRREHRAPLPRRASCRGSAPATTSSGRWTRSRTTCPSSRPFVARRARGAGEALVYFRFARHAPLVAGRATARRSTGSHPAVGFESFTAEIHRVIEDGGPGRVLRVRLPLRPRGRLVLGPDARQLLHGHLPVPVRARHGHLLRAPARQPLARGGGLDPQHDAAPPRRLPPRAARSTSTRSRCRAAPVAHHVPAARAGGRRVPPAHRERGRSPRCSPTSPTGGSTRSRRHDLWDRKFQQATRRARRGTAPARRPSRRRASIFEQLLRMMLTRDEPRRRARRALARPARPARHPPPHDRHRPHRRQGGRHARRPRHPRSAQTRAGASASSRTTPGSSAPTSSTRTSSATAAGARAASSASPETFLDGAARGARADPRRRLPRLHPDASSRRCSSTTGSRPSSSARRRCSRTASATPSPASTTASSARTRARPRSGSRRSSPRSAQVYASTMSEEALRYREHRGLLDRDEQMALLVQRVSGAVHGDALLPAGGRRRALLQPVGLEPPRSTRRPGVVRLVFGLGTRAVDRADDDYTRLVALNAPLAPPGGEPRRGERVRAAPGGRARPRARTASTSLPLRRGGAPAAPECRSTSSPPTRRGGAAGAHLRRAPRRDAASSRTLRAMLRTLADAYRYPVDVEFTANFLAGGELRLNVVQCRPLQVKEGGIVDAAARRTSPAGAVAAREPRARSSARARTRRWTAWCSSTRTPTTRLADAGPLRGGAASSGG